MTHRKTLLVVEDDFDIADTLKDVLSDAGYTVVWAENGQKALEYLRSQPRPSLILLDLMMPGMDGSQFRQQQLQTPSIADIPVVVLTASREFNRVRELGMEGFIMKPFKLNELLETVRRLLEPRQGLSASNGSSVA